MTPSSAALGRYDWHAAKRRADKLYERRGHARELLTVYRAVLQRQQPVYRDTLAAPWIAAPLRSGPPEVDLGGLPWDTLVAAFRRFVVDLSPELTEVLRSVAASLARADEGLHHEVLQRFARRDTLEGVAVRLDCNPAQLAFFPHAFLQPVVRGVAEGSEPDVPDGGAPECPRCGWPPNLSVMRDEPEHKGRRWLVCALCRSWQPYTRSRCPNCGEADPEKLAYHASDDLPHVRIEECEACGTYLKAVDLRKDGSAVPEVDDVATVELDLWCAERGLRKVQRNVFGF